MAWPELFLFPSPCSFDKKIPNPLQHLLISLLKQEIRPGAQSLWQWLSPARRGIPAWYPLPVFICARSFYLWNLILIFQIWLWCQVASLKYVHLYQQQVTRKRTLNKYCRGAWGNKRRTRFLSLLNLQPLSTSLWSPNDGISLQSNPWGTGWGKEPPSRDDRLQWTSNVGSETHEQKVTLTKPDAVGTLWFLQARGGQQQVTMVAHQCGQTSQTASRCSAKTTLWLPHQGWRDGSVNKVLLCTGMRIWARTPVPM